MFLSFFPQPKAFFLSVILWSALTVAIWYGAARDLGNLFGIVSFIAYGLLCTAVGYFAPAPPRRATSAEVSA